MKRLLVFLALSLFAAQSYADQYDGVWSDGKPKGDYVILLQNGSNLLMVANARDMGRWEAMMFTFTGDTTIRGSTVMTPGCGTVVATGIFTSATAAEITIESCTPTACCDDDMVAGSTHYLTRIY